MIQHFFIVGIPYLVLIILNGTGKLPVTWWALALQSCGLLGLDYIVHCHNHEWTRLKLPWLSIVWTLLVIGSATVGWFEYGWQVAIILFAQAWWDNSQHSVDHHRPKDKPTTHTDRVWIRGGALLLAVASIIIPRAI